MAQEIIKDPVTGNQYSRDTDITGSTYQPYTDPVIPPQSQPGDETSAVEEPPIVPTAPQDSYDYKGSQDTVNDSVNDLTESTDKYQKQADKVNKTITNIQNGTVPLNEGEKAQIESLRQQYGELIAQQKLANTSAEGYGNIRGYQAGAAEYDPSFQAKIIGSIVTAGLNKVAALNTKMAGAIAELTQSIKDNKVKAVKDAWDVFQK